MARTHGQRPREKLAKEKISRGYEWRHSERYYKNRVKVNRVEARKARQVNKTGVFEDAPALIATDGTGDVGIKSTKPRLAPVPP